MLLARDRKSGECCSEGLTDWHLLNSAPHTFLSRDIIPSMQKEPQLHAQSKQSNDQAFPKRLVHAPKLLVCPKQALFSCKDKSRCSNSRTHQIRQ